MVWLRLDCATRYFVADSVLVSVVEGVDIDISVSVWLEGRFACGLTTRFSCLVGLK